MKHREQTFFFKVITDFFLGNNYNTQIFRFFCVDYHFDFNEYFTNFRKKKELIKLTYQSRNEVAIIKIYTYIHSYNLLSNNEFKLLRFLKKKIIFYRIINTKLEFNNDNKKFINKE